MEHITAMTTDHCKLGEYLHRFNVSGYPTCSCQKNSQTVGCILSKCELIQESDIQIKLLIENKFIICALGNLYYKISREKFEQEPGFETRTSGFLARRSTT